MALHNVLFPMAAISTMNVVIAQQTVISSHGEKPFPVPADLIQEHGGRQWLKLRPTNYGINRIICGSKGGKVNASFSNHEKYQSFLQKRNQLWLKDHDEEPLFKKEAKEQVPEETGKTKAKKRKRCDDPEVLQVPLGTATIDCLMQGQRPTKSDLVVPLEAKHLEPIMAMVQKSPDSLNTRKAYTKKKKANTEKDTQEGKSKED